MIVKFLADENFNNHLLRLLRIKAPECDVVRAQDVGLKSTPDPEVLEWAAATNRVVLTHDADTMVGLAYDRVRRLLPMPGLVVVRSLDQSAQVFSDFVVAVACGVPNDFQNLVMHLPF